MVLVAQKTSTSKLATDITFATITSGLVTFDTVNLINSLQRKEGVESIFLGSMTALSAFLVARSGTMLSRDIAERMGRHNILKSPELESLGTGFSSRLESYPDMDVRITDNFSRDTNLTVNWKKDWHTMDAIREFGQNVLDEKRLGHATKFGMQNVNGDLLIWDNGRGAPLKELLYLGEGSKGNSHVTAGIFGSGLKIAYVVLAREGHPVDVISRDVIIRPFVAKDTLAGEDYIKLDITKLEHDAFDGTCIIVHGAGKLQGRACALFSEFSKKKVVAVRPIKADDTVLYDKVIQEDKPRLYIRGIRFSNLSGKRSEYNALFSYDLNGKASGGKDLMTGEDRLAPEWRTVRASVGGVLSALKNPDAIKLLLDWLCEKDNSLEGRAILSSTDLAVVDKAAWKKAITEKYGPKCYILTDRANITAIEYEASAYKPIALLNTSSYWLDLLNKAVGIPFDHEMLRPKPVKTAEEVKYGYQHIPFEELSERQKRNFVLIREVFASHKIDLHLIEGKSKRRLIGFSSNPLYYMYDHPLLFLTPEIKRIGIDVFDEIHTTNSDDKDDVDIQGRALSDRVIIRSGALDDFSYGLMTAIHETVHYRSNLGDSSPSFGSALSYETAKMLPSIYSVLERLDPDERAKTLKTLIRVDSLQRDTDSE